MNTGTNNNITSNKLAVIHVLAALIQNPLLFSDDRYSFAVEDFPKGFHQIVFGAVEHLAKSGMEKIGYIDIDQFLKQYDAQYLVFTTNKGVEYIQNALAMYDEKKFDYYYQALKKNSLLNELNKAHIDTTDIYDPDIVDPVKSAEMYEKFDNLSVNDIISKKEADLIHIKDKFGTSADRVENDLGEGILDLVDELKEVPVMGLSFTSPNLNAIFRGQRLGCLNMISAASGSGKTRFMVAQACKLAIKECYDGDAGKWVINCESPQKCLLIETELELREVQTMALAYVSNVSESHILDGRYDVGEEERVRKAAQLIKNSELKVVELTNYGVEDLINVIKKYHQIYKTDYFYYDYLSENSKLLAECTKKTKVALRTDQILLEVATRLKDTAKTLNIYVMTATQLSGDYKNATELDTSYLRAAKSLGDKLDCGAILTPVREVDQGPIDAYCAKGFETTPNFVLAVYKVRRGSFQNIKLYLDFNRGTCRTKDAFVTDNKGNILPIKGVELEMKTTTKSDKTKAGKKDEVGEPEIDIDTVLDQTSFPTHSIGENDSDDDLCQFDF